MSEIEKYSQDESSNMVVGASSLFCKYVYIITVFTAFKTIRYNVYHESVWAST